MSIYLTVFSIFLGFALTAMVDTIPSKSIPVFQKTFLLPAYFVTIIRYYHGNVLFYTREFKAIADLSKFGIIAMVHFIVVCIEFLTLYIIAKEISNISNVLLGFMVLFAIDFLWLFTSSTRLTSSDRKKPPLVEAVITAVLFLVVLSLFLVKLSVFWIVILLSITLILGTIISYYLQRDFYFGEEAREI